MGAAREMERRQPVEWRKAAHGKAGRAPSLGHGKRPKGAAPSACLGALNGAMCRHTIETADKGTSPPTLKRLWS